MQHAHHDLTVASLHAHLDHDHCLESVILKGPTATVRKFSEALIAERGVRHGLLNVVSVSIAESRHNHGYRPLGKATTHTHLKPKG